MPVSPRTTLITAILLRPKLSITTRCTGRSKGSTGSSSPTTYTAAPALTSLLQARRAFESVGKANSCGRDSTNSFASLRPMPVSSRTTLITAILLPPKLSSTTILSSGASENKGPLHSETACSKGKPSTRADAPTARSWSHASVASSCVEKRASTVGEDSTSSLASFRPKPVSPRTTLMTAILLRPKLSSITVRGESSSRCTEEDSSWEASYPRVNSSKDMRFSFSLVLP